MSVHPSAIIDPRAIVDVRATIGPMVVISGRVKIGPGTVVDPFVHILGFTEIGAQCHIHTGAVIGDLPQDRQYEGGESYCRVGNQTVVREGATIHRGTAPGSTTSVGHRCLLMANAHVGHNCTVGDDVTLVNGALLGGYVSLADKAIVSGNAAIHQFVRIGELAMVGGLAKVTQDVPPYMMVDGSGKCIGLNSVGLRRAGFSAQDREAIKVAFRILYRSGLSLREGMEAFTGKLHSPAVQRLVDFVQEPSSRGIAGGSHRPTLRVAA